MLGFVGRGQFAKSRSATRRGPALAILVLSAAIFQAVGPSSTAQTTTPADIALSATLYAQHPIIAEGIPNENWIRGVVVNEGNAPASVRIKITADGDVLHNATHVILPGAANRQEVSLGWAGPTLASGREKVDLQLDASVRADEQVEDVYHVAKVLNRAVQRNDLRFEPDAEFSPRATIEPGQSLVVTRVIVRNTGNVRDIARLGFSNPTWDFVASADTIDLQPGESTPVYVTAKSPDMATAGSKGTATLELRTSEQRATETLRDSVPLQSPTVQAGNSLRVTVNPPVLFAKPGDNAEIGIRVFNPTARQTTVAIATTGVGTPQDIPLSGTPSGPATLAAGESLTFTLSGVVPGRTPADQSQALAGLRTWNLAVSEDATGEILASAPVLLDVTQVFLVDLAAPVEGIPAEAVPGGPLVVPLRLSNSGNGPDRLCVNATMPSGWSQPEQCLSLAPWQGSQAWADLAWNVDLASNVASGPQQVEITAVSEESGSSVRSIPQRLTIDVAERTHPRLVVSAGPARPVPVNASVADNRAMPFRSAVVPCDFPANPGQTVSIPAELRNEGNMGSTFRLSVAGLQSIPSAGWTVQFPTDSIELPPGSSQSVTLDVTAPETLDPLDRTSFNLRLQDLNESARVDAVACRVEAAFADLTPAPSTPFARPGDLYAGHSAELLFLVANTGWNRTWTGFNVESQVKGPNGFAIRHTHALTALEPIRSGQTWWHPLSLNFLPPKPGTYTYTIQTDVNGTIDEMGPTSNDRLTGQVTVLDFGIRIVPPIGRIVIPEQRVAFEGTSAFKIRNEGTRHHDLEITVDMEPVWRGVERRSISLGPGQERSIDVNFTVPQQPFAAGAALRLRAANASLSSLSVEGLTRVRIDDNEAPTITDLKAKTPNVLVGENVGFKAYISDAAGIGEARLYVSRAGAGVTSYPMKGNGPVGDFEAAVRFDSVGEYSVHAWARDASVSNNTATTQDRPLRIEVLSADRPHIRLVTPANGSAVRPGVPIVLTVLSKQPVAMAEYAKAGEAAVPLPLANPIQIPTDGWDDGTVSIRVMARDSLHVEAIETFAFLIDGVAPQVTSIMLNPDRASAGEVVRISATILDDSQLQSVVARLDSSGRTQEIRMAPDGAGTWSADFEMPEGPVTLAVIASDSAGNQGYGELLQGYDSKNGESRSRFLPTIAVASTLLVVAVGIIVYHRRLRST